MIQQLIDVSPNKVPFVKPDSGLPKHCYNIISNKIFEVFILVVIICNLITMTMEYDDSPNLYFSAIEKISLIFTLIFIIEFLLKIIALGFKEYFNDTWNNLDFIVAITGIVDIILVLTSEDVGLGFSGIFKVFQIVRVFRLIRVVR